MNGYDIDESMREANRLMRNLRWMKEAREAKAKRARVPEGRYLPKISGNREMAKRAILRQPVPDDKSVEFWVLHTPMRDEWLRMRERPDMSEYFRRVCNPDAMNGYVAYPKRHAPKVADGTGNLVQYIPVHGGVTYAEKDSYAAVWGFDTMHTGSEKQPISDPAWILGNCWILYRGLTLAAQLWPEFRRANQHRRAELADHLLALVEEQPLMEKLGFEALIGLLAGRVG